MANRAYLYSLDHCPRSYADRPTTITGLSEWPYGIPLSYRILASADPVLCPSLIADGLEDDDPDRRTPLWAICADFDRGHARLLKLLHLLRPLAEAPSSLAMLLLRALKLSASKPERRLPALASAMDRTRAFLGAHEDRHVLLETVELDLMTAGDPATLRRLAEEELARCRAAGAAIDALPCDVQAGARALQDAAAGRAAGALSALRGIRLDDLFDHTRDGSTRSPLGLSFWDTALYFAPRNRAEFEARAAAAD